MLFRQFGRFTESSLDDFFIHRETQFGEFIQRRPAFGRRKQLSPLRPQRLLAISRNHNEGTTAAAPASISSNSLFVSAEAWLGYNQANPTEASTMNASFTAVLPQSVT
jgi:hypothetical protein